MVFNHKSDSDDTENLEPQELVHSQVPEQEIPATPSMDVDDDSETDDWFEGDTPAWQRWVRYVAIVAVVLVAALLIGRTVHHHLNANKAKQSVASASQHPTAPAATPAPAKSGATSGTNTTTTTSSNLPNTGPGNVLAIFAGATVVASAGHYIVRRSRA